MKTIVIHSKTKEKEETMTQFIIRCNKELAKNVNHYATHTKDCKNKTLYVTISVVSS